VHVAVVALLSWSSTRGANSYRAARDDSKYYDSQPPTRISTAATQTPAAVAAVAKYPQTQTVSIPVHLQRYANHAPLVDISDDGLSCCIAAALRKVNWSLLGYKLTLSESLPAPVNTTTTTTQNALPCDGSTMKVSSSGASSTCHTWHLVPQRDEVIELARQYQQKGRGLALTLLVDAYGQNIPFANMRKTAISADWTASIPSEICRLTTTGKF